MNNLLRLVAQMHHKFDINHAKLKFSKEEKNFRTEQMFMEIEKYQKAHSQERQLDALVDIVIFAIGTAERQGFAGIFEEAYKAIMSANMKKEIAINQDADTKEFILKLVKPHDWQAAPIDKFIKTKSICEEHVVKSKQLSLFEYAEKHSKNAIEQTEEFKAVHA